MSYADPSQATKLNFLEIFLQQGSEMALYKPPARDLSSFAFKVTVQAKSSEQLPKNLLNAYSKPFALYSDHLSALLPFQAVELLDIMEITCQRINLNLQGGIGIFNQAAFAAIDGAVFASSFLGHSRNLASTWQELVTHGFCDWSAVPQWHANHIAFQVDRDLEDEVLSYMDQNDIGAVFEASKNKPVALAKDFYQPIGLASTINSMPLMLVNDMVYRLMAIPHVSNDSLSDL